MGQVKSLPSKVPQDYQATAEVREITKAARHHSTARRTEQEI
jgi:hypothetical protein